MSSVTEARAIFGGAEAVNEYELASQIADSFLTRVDQLWKLYTVPRAIVAGIKKQSGERVYKDDPIFVIIKDSEDQISNPVIVWRMGSGYPVEIRLESDPMVITDNSGDIYAHEVPNSMEILKGWYEAYIDKSEQSIAFFKEDSWLLEEFYEPLFERDVKHELLDLKTASQFLGLIDLDNIKVIGWMDDDDTDKGDRGIDMYDPDEEKLYADLGINLSGFDENKGTN